MHDYYDEDETFPAPLALLILCMLAAALFGPDIHLVLCKPTAAKLIVGAALFYLGRKSVKWIGNK